MFYSWKFAANAVWEEALSIDATAPIDVALIEKWVAQNPQNVALEAIFAENNIPSTMFGIRITSLPKAEQVARIKKMVSRTSEIKTEGDLKKTANETFPEFTLFTGKLEALNIGIVSQWYSLGPEVVWNRQTEQPLSLNELKEKAPRFFDHTRNPAAIEFWYTHTTDHWYKIYVSDLNPSDGYLINPVKYQSAINRLAAFGQKS